MDRLMALLGSPLLPLLFLAAALMVLGAAIVLPWLARRPQRGLLMLALLVPLDGLLVLVPHPGIVDGWKEGLVLLTACLALFAKPVASGRPSPPWVHPLVVLVAVAVVSALLVGGMRGLLGLKIGYFYLLLPAILWRCPFSPRERDALVSVMMFTAVVTAAYGLAQQVIGITRLNQVGYEYDVTLRTAGGILRSFSTFSQPFPFGLYLMAALLVGGSVALSDVGRLRNAAFLLASPVVALAMGTSVVRASYLGLALGVVFLGLVLNRWLLLVPMLGLAFLAVLPVRLLSAAFSSSSLRERQGGWTEIPLLVLSRPWGYGLSSTGSAAEKLSEVTGAAYTGYQPDNMYAKVLLELGIVGLWLFALVLVGAFLWVLGVSSELRRTLRIGQMDAAEAAQVRQDNALALGIAASILAALAASVVATYLEIFPMDVFFWLLLGVVTCIAAQRSSSTLWPCDPEAAVSRPISVS